MDVIITDFLASRWSELWLRTGEHLILTGFSTALAIILGIPLGILAFRNTRFRAPLLGTVGIFQTIPSLAMLAILLAILQKIGALPAIIALTIYALLPIVRNTVTGLEGVSSEITEAARGIGMTEQQEMWIIKMPLAIPVIMAGIRTAAVVGVGIATLSAFIGAGGLGQFINRGLALSSTPLILLGAIPAALLALLVDFSLGAAEWSLRPMRQSEKKTIKVKLKPIALLLPLLLMVVGIYAYFTGSFSSSTQQTEIKSGQGKIRIASKNFTEQIILGELMAQLIESQTDLSIERHFNLGGTMISHGALIKGEIDLYAEYTGTGLTAILKHKVVSDPDEALKVVRQGYRDRFQVEWLNPFGFNNTYAITVRKADAERYGWRKISDLAEEAIKLRAGFTSEFAERPDGYSGLRQAYGYSLGDVKDLDPALMYDAISIGEVDVICAFATDGRIEGYKLKPLIDDRHFFPPYYAAPVIRMEVLKANPEIRKVLILLAGIITNSTMQRMNYEVDLNKSSPEKVAREFLITHNLIEPGINKKRE
jgi:osmoprotectant transport system permease protein